MDEQPVPPQADCENHVVIDLKRKIDQLREELKQKDRIIAELTSYDILMNVNVRRPNSDLIINWSENMSYDAFVKSTEGKDVNHCYYGEWPLAFYFTMHLPKPAYSAWPEAPNRYYQHMMFMLSRGLDPNMRFKDRSLLKTTDDALIQTEQDLVYYKNLTDPTGRANYVPQIMNLDHTAQRYREIRDELRRRGATS